MFPALSRITAFGSIMAFVAATGVMLGTVDPPPAITAICNAAATEPDVAWAWAVGCGMTDSPKTANIRVPRASLLFACVGKLQL